MNSSTFRVLSYNIPIACAGAIKPSLESGDWALGIDISYFSGSCFCCNNLSLSLTGRSHINWQVGYNPMCVCSVTQSYPTVCDPMNYSPPSSSVCGISHVRILEWVPISSSWGSSGPRDWTRVSWQVDSLPVHHLGSPVYNPIPSTVSSIVLYF